jgi:S1-C subfamily serine protease
MKRLFFTAIFLLSMIIDNAGYAEQNAEDILKAVVKIRAVIRENAFTAPLLGTEREGNGVLIDSDGHILTIGYLILEAKSIEVTGPDGQVIEAAFVGYDYDTGFGLLRANKPLNVKPMNLGSSSDLVVGDPALVAGHEGSEAVVGVRIVSRGEFVGYWEYLLENAIFTTPPYQNYGGAALIDSDGSLLGIGSIFTQVTITGFGSIHANMFVPIDLLKPILSDLITVGRSRRPLKPWLGLNSEESHGRVFVIRITPGSPAEKANLRIGDLILKVDNQAVSGQADFYRKVWALGKAGVKVPISILRGTEIQDINVHSADRYQFLKPQAESEAIKPDL